MPKSKSKKRKPTHAHPYSPANNQAQSSTATNHELSHDQIWDDSALIRSWNEAVTEYEFYHSIHARGEDVDEVLKRLKRPKLVPKEQVGDEYGFFPDEVDYLSDEQEPYGGIVAKVYSDEDGEIPDDDADRNDADAARIESRRSAVMASLKRDDICEIDVDHTKPDSIIHDRGFPPSIDRLNPVQAQNNVHTDAELQNQTLENIKMAYYWAGYYSGLYDGQRQTQTAPPTAPTLGGNTSGAAKEEGEV